MEKLLKTIESLRNPVAKKKEVTSSPKEKSGFCLQIVDLLHSKDVKIHPDYAKTFSTALEVLFLQCDDSSADVRLVAEDSINTIIRHCCSEGNVNRIHVELWRELKRAGSARSLRSALAKFSILSEQIVFKRARPFAQNLVPCFMALLKRPEESIFECFEKVQSPILISIGRFFTDEEIKTLIQAALQNLQLPSAQMRRCSAAFLVELCKRSRKKFYFSGYLLAAILDILIPVKTTTSNNHIVGIFTTLRLLIPLIRDCDDEYLLANQAFKISLAKTNAYKVTLDSLLKIYEIIIYYVCSSNTSVVTCALESLHSLLQNLPRRLQKMLKSGGIEKSRIFDADSSSPNVSTLSSRIQSLSTLNQENSSATFSLTFSQSNLCNAEEISDQSNNILVQEKFPDFNTAKQLVISSPLSPARERIEAKSLEEKVDQDIQPLIFSVQDQNNPGAYSNMAMGELLEGEDDDDEPLLDLALDRTQSPISDSFTNQQLTSTPDKKSELDHKAFSEPLMTPMSEGSERKFAIFSSYPSDIGTLCDSDFPMRFLCRCLCRKFLLLCSSSTNFLGQNEAMDTSDGDLSIFSYCIPDRDVRVSQKVLALSCVASLIDLEPELMEEALTNQGPHPIIRDLFAYTRHSDHLLRGETFNLASCYLKSFLHRPLENRAGSNLEIVQECFSSICLGLCDEHFSATRAALIALKQCQQEILFNHDLWTFDQLQNLFYSILYKSLKHTYWAVKLSALELWHQFDFTMFRFLEYLDQKRSLHQIREVYDQKVLNLILNEMLADENVKVRNEASAVICSIVTNSLLMEKINWFKYASYLSERDQKLKFHNSSQFVWYQTDFDQVHNINSDFCCHKQKRLTNEHEENLSLLIVKLFELLAVPKTPCHLSGILATLSKLAELYPPANYENCWSLILTNDPENCAQYLSHLLKLPSNWVLGIEMISVHQSLFKLLSTFLAGFVSNRLHKKLSPTDSENRWPLLMNTTTNSSESPRLSQMDDFLTNDLLPYCLKILNGYFYVVTENVPPGPPTILAKAAPIPQMVAQQTLVPVAQKLKSVAKMDGAKTISADKSDQLQLQPISNSSYKTKVGDFYGSAYFTQIYELVKALWINYKRNIDQDVTEKFTILLNSSLDCLSCILEVATLKVIDRFAEELLMYLKPIMIFSPKKVISTVTQVLKTLFGTNLNLLAVGSKNDEIMKKPNNPMGDVIGASLLVSSPSTYMMSLGGAASLYQTCIVKTRTRFAQSMAAASARHDLLGEAISRHLGWFGSRADKFVINLLKKPAHKTTLANFIRCFEQIVVQALQFYTNCISMEAQASVIALLIQLIQIRVNYCLLDRDLRFLNYLFEQLETIDCVDLLKKEQFVNDLFEFFVVLSYEKYLNKSVVDAPKILQLADTFLASASTNTSGQDLSALHSVVIDFFLLRQSAKLESAQELETQQDCLVAVLMKSISSIEAIDTFTIILYKTKRDNESKWKKLSRDVVDGLLPLFGKEFTFRDMKSFQAVVNLVEFLHSGAFRPCDNILELLFKPMDDSYCTEPEHFSSWLCIKYWCLYALMIHCKEDSVLARLEGLQSKLAQNLADFLPNRFIENDKETHSFTTTENCLAKLLKLILDIGMEKLVSETKLKKMNENQSLQRETIYRWLQLLVHICQSGAYRVTSNQLTTLFAESAKINYFTTGKLNFLAQYHSDVLLQYFYLLASLQVFNQEYWMPILEKSQNCKLKYVRKVAIVLYCDHLHGQISELSKLGKLPNQLSFNQYLAMLTEPPVHEFMSSAIKDSLLCSEILKSMVDCMFLKKFQIDQKCQMIQLAKSSSKFLNSELVVLFTKCFTLPYYHLVTVAETSLIEMLEKHINENVPIELEILDVLQGVLKNSKRTFPKIEITLQRLTEFFSLQHTENITMESIDMDLKETLQTHPSKFKKPKLTQLIRILMQHSEKLKLESVVAKILATSFSMEECVELLSDWHVTSSLFEACLRFENKIDIELADKESAVTNYQKTNLQQATCHTLMSTLKILVVKFKAKDDTSQFGIDRLEFNNPNSDLSESEVEKLMDLNRSIKFMLTKCDYRPSEIEETVLVQYCNFLLQTLATSKNFSISFMTTIEILEMVIVVLKLEFASLINHNYYNSTSLQRNMIGLSFWIITQNLNIGEMRRLDLKLPVFPTVDPKTSIIWNYILMMLNWMENSILIKTEINCKVINTCRRLIIALARLPIVQSIARIPINVYTFGWEPEIKHGGSENGPIITVPAVPVRYLQNVDVLKSFMFRTQWIGWTSRQDFEEIWMGLLGVLSATPVGAQLKEASVQETTERVCASTVAVKCLTGLLMQSLLFPKAGSSSSSRYIFKSREKRSTFLGSETGARLMRLKKLIARRQCVLESDFGQNNVGKNAKFGINLERMHNFLQYSYGQFPVETLWSLTGILAEEQNLLQKQPENTSISSEKNDPSLIDEKSIPKIDKSVESIDSPGRNTTVVSLSDRRFSDFLRETQNELNLPSCLHFLLDLYNHWLSGGPDSVPLSLLAATVESIVLLSDLFSEQGQYAWLKEKLSSVYLNRAVNLDDELILQDTVFGMLKAQAILGVADFEKDKETLTIIDSSLRLVQLSARIATLHGILYVLQTMTSDEIVGIMPIISDYILTNLSIYVLFDGENVVLEKPQSLDHQLLCLSIAFFIVESFHDPHTKQSFAPKFLETCMKALQNKHLPTPIFNAFCLGLEYLSINCTTSIDTKFWKQIVTFSTETIASSDCSNTVLVGTSLLLTYLYTAKENRRSGENSTFSTTDPAQRNSSGEETISAMEKLSLFLNKISKGSSREASILANMLGEYLQDNFSPGDVMNKIISELLRPSQAHIAELMQLLVSIVDALLLRETKSLVGEWLLLSLPSFTHQENWHLTNWCLIALFLCSSSNDFVRTLWVMAKCAAKEENGLMLKFSIESFKTQLEDEKQIDSLKATLQQALIRQPENISLAKACK